MVRKYAIRQGCKGILTLFAFLTFSQVHAQTKFIDPTGTYTLQKTGLKDSLNIYTRMDIKWIAGTRIAMRLYINSRYGVVMRPMSFIYEDNMIVYRTADDYPGCNTVFYVKQDTLRVLDLKPDAHSPCVRRGGMWAGGLYIRTSKAVPVIGGSLEVR